MGNGIVVYNLIILQSNKIFISRTSLSIKKYVEKAILICSMKKEILDFRLLKESIRDLQYNEKKGEAKIVILQY